MSGSGRGIRYVKHEMNNHQTNWAKNIISNQGGIVIEPYYNKVKDFAMSSLLIVGKLDMLGYPCLRLFMAYIQGV